MRGPKLLQPALEGNMEGRRRREAGLITFPADFTGGREWKITAPPAHCSRPPLLPPLLPAFWSEARGDCFPPSAHWAFEGVMDGFIRRQDPSLIHKISLNDSFIFCPSLYVAFELLPDVSDNSPHFFFYSFSTFYSLSVLSFLLSREWRNVSPSVSFPPSFSLRLWTDVEAFLSQHSPGRVGTGLNTLLEKRGGRGEVSLLSEGSRIGSQVMHK